METNLCTYLNYTTPFVCNRKQVDIICFDMSKAFDKDCHDIFVSKLKRYSLYFTYWGLFESYISGHGNSVRVSGVLFDHYSSSSGKPQASSVPPLLYYFVL